jgi:crotonobetainyl-CoA:carnitine CoA-transferase CaiB-like acyl-CoA transferase
MTALEGLRVIDQTQVMAGPTCAMLLADLGADVIKVEPPEGETTRHLEPAIAPGMSGAFVAVNRNKRGITLDLKQRSGAETLKRLVVTADVLVENYRPGVARRLGVDYATLRAMNPRLVYCSISGFGQTGPYATRGGYDLIAQGMSGIMSVTGHEGGPPVKVGVPIADLGAGLFGVLGILCALRARRVTGRGQFVDTSLYEAGVALSVWEATEYWYTGQVPKRLGTAHRMNGPYQAFRASDGYFTVGASNDKLWAAFASLLGLDRLLTDPRFASVGGRVAHRAELESLIEAMTVTKPKSHWLVHCEEAGIPAGPIYTVPEALDDPHARARAMTVAIEHPELGRVQALGNPVKMSKSPPTLRKLAPRLGEDNDAILRELAGMTKDVPRLAGGEPSDHGASAGWAGPPLRELRVVDLTHQMAGPFGTMNLADMGADVIKIEPPGEGEPTRRLGAMERNGHSATFMAVNRNKRSLTVDLKRPEGLAILLRLVRTADVFVQNYRPGVAKRLGVDYEALSVVNPRLVYCTVSGFGATGPYASRGGYDLIAQGMSGIISVTGEENGPPAKAGIPVGDLAAGLFAAYGILAALAYRDRTGEGQFVDTSLLEAALALTVWESTEYWVARRTPKPLGSAHRLAAPYQAIRAADGYFTVGANTDRLFDGFCRAIERRDLLEDSRFRGRTERLAHRDALLGEIEKTTIAESRVHWLERLEGAGVPAGPINTYPETLADPHTLARAMVVDLVHPGAGPIKALGIPVKLSGTPGAVDRPAPLVGQHTAEILTELGFSEAEQRSLRERGVV